MPDSPLAGVMDNPYYDWSPIHRRPPLRWPGGARIAVVVLVSLEHAEWYPDPNAVLVPSLRGARAYPSLPNVHELSQWEYGNRVGVFRVTEALERHRIRPTIAADVAVLERSPFLVDHLLGRGAEFIGHGVASNRMITEEMPEADERSQIATALAAVHRITGQQPRGWLGAAYGESTRTVRLLAEQGVSYVCDWPTDEQPHRLKVANGSLINLPVNPEMDDVVTHVGRFLPIERFTRMITEQFDRLYADGATSGRLLVLHVHPWVMGQPFRIAYFERAIAHLSAAPDVWLATGAEVTSWFAGLDGLDGLASPDGLPDPGGLDDPDGPDGLQDPGGPGSVDG